MTGGGGDGRRRLTDDERVLWTTVTKAIAPLRRAVKIEPAEPQSAPVAARGKPRAAKPQTPAPPRKPETDSPPLVPLGRRMKQRVARGKDAIDGRLDLHGLTQSEAHAALARFLRAASAREARLVLVITGKGRANAGGEPGVLRRQVPLWLKLPEFRDYVIGYEPAAIAHGGEGALYVRVRRARRAE